MKIKKATNYIYIAYQPYYSVDGFMCSVLNFVYRSVCGINTLPSLAK